MSDYNVRELWNQAIQSLEPRLRDEYAEILRLREQENLFQIDMKRAGIYLPINNEIIVRMDRWEEETGLQFPTFVID